MLCHPHLLLSLIFGNSVDSLRQHRAKPSNLSSLVLHDSKSGVFDDKHYEQVRGHKAGQKDYHHALCGQPESNLYDANITSRFSFFWPSAWRAGEAVRNENTLGLGALIFSTCPPFQHHQWLFTTIHLGTLSRLNCHPPSHCPTLQLFKAFICIR